MGHRGGERARTPRSPTRSTRGLVRENGGPSKGPTESLHPLPLPYPPSLPVFHCWRSFPTHNAPGWVCKLISRTVANRHRCSIISKHRDIQPSGKWVDQGEREKGEEEKGWYPDRAPSSEYVNQDQRSLCALRDRGRSLFLLRARVRNSRLWKDSDSICVRPPDQHIWRLYGYPRRASARNRARERFRLHPLFAFKRRALRYIRYLRNDNRKITYV